MEKSTTSRNAAEMTTARITAALVAAGDSCFEGSSCSIVAGFMISFLNLGGLGPAPHPGSRGRGPKVLAAAPAPNPAGGNFAGPREGPVPASPARPHVHLRHHRRVPPRPPPPRDELRVRVCPKDSVPGGVEHAGHDDLPLPPVRDELRSGGFLREGGGELLEGLAPALPRHVTVQSHREPSVAQRHPRLPSEVLKGNHDDEL